MVKRLQIQSPVTSKDFPFVGQISGKDGDSKKIRVKIIPTKHAPPDMIDKTDPPLPNTTPMSDLYLDEVSFGNFLFN